jgi:hypothetical protein
MVCCRNELTIVCRLMIFPYVEVDLTPLLKVELTCATYVLWESLSGCFAVLPRVRRHFPPSRGVEEHAPTSVDVAINERAWLLQLQSTTVDLLVIAISGTLRGAARVSRRYRPTG